jgi:ABC-2 type transport system permease protein
MKTMKWLLRREFWEHKGAFFWAPLAISAILSLLIATILGFGGSADSINASYNVHGTQGSAVTIAAHLGDEQKAQLADIMSRSYMFISAPIFLTLSFIIFFYCLSALYDERRDRSILFWKSLPISDSMTVLSKLAMAAFVVPLITIIMATATSALVLLMFCITLAFKGVNMFDILFTTPTVYLTPLQIVSLLPVYVLWALPTMGWLLMVSSWARSKAFLWAVGVPLLSVVMLYWVARMFHLQWDIVWYAKNIIARILLGVLPGVWFPFTGIGQEQLMTPNHFSIGMEAISTQSWSTLSNPELWIGVAAGAAMIYVAIRMRRWREE